MKTPPKEFRRHMMALAGVVIFIVILSTLLALAYPPARQPKNLAAQKTENEIH